MLGLRPRVYRHVVVNFTRNVRTRSARDRPSPGIAHESRLPPTIAHTIQQAASPQRQKTSKIRNQAGLYGGLVIACLLGFYCTQIAGALLKASEDKPVVELSEQKDVAERYEEIADSFDSDVNVSEWLMGILKHRKRLAKMCSGNVLEVSCGTGRNVGYFDIDSKDRQIESLTLIDLSPKMVQLCKKKFMVLHGGSRDARARAKANPMSIRLIAGSALDEMPLAPDGRKYDTIIQTMGLCSTPSPAELIINMARHLELENPDARILLLEHGRSHYDWLNRVLDNTAQKHADVYGCWFNRDLDAIVNEAATKAGLDVVRTKRHDLGTTFVYELKAGPDAADKIKQHFAVTPKAETAQSIWSRWFANKQSE